MIIKKIFDNFSFSIPDNKITFVMGESGSGKTTLLRILIGLETKDSGEIFKDGQEISALPSSERGMGIVFQNYALFPNMNVLQNVKYALTLRKDTKEKAEEIAMQTIEHVGLIDQIHKYPNQLSGSLIPSL